MFPILTLPLFQIAPPYSVIGGDAVVYSEAGQKIGRQYPWGFAEVNNEEHCDYITLHDILLKLVFNGLLYPPYHGFYGQN